MTENRYDHFRKLKSGAEYLVEVEAAADSTPPPHPESMDFDPVQTGQGRWQVPNDHRVFRTRDEARRAGLTARARANREYANHVNALPVPQPTPGQEAANAYESAKAMALSEGVTPEAWASSSTIREKYLPDSRHGSELWEEHKSKK